ncbi:MAG TPA: SDR family oxidoreductase [Vicinamibacteria bacterium]|nr:SDR family oxidoreductase [Vicinamibacteria bacterium]
MNESLADLVALRGKRALVTGGGGAIGGAIVSRLHQAGAAVWSVDLPGRAAPAGARALEADLADASAADTLAAEIGRDGGTLDVLVHCAGVTRDLSLAKLSAADWSAVLRVNLDSAFHLLHAALPLLKASGGASVVFISSINAERGKAGQASYAASKAGLIGLARTAALELGRHGVRVNCVSPGWIDTPMTAAVPEEYRQRALAETALGRLGHPDDVARAVLFLCCALGRHVTGQVVRVDGGQLMA